MLFDAQKRQKSCFCGEIRNAENSEDTQKDSYQLGILTLNLGHINRHPYIGGSSKFPSWVRKDNDYRALPYLIIRHSAHIVTVCEAHDELVALPLISNLPPIIQ